MRARAAEKDTARARAAEKDTMRVRAAEKRRQRDSYKATARAAGDTTVRGTVAVRVSESPRILLMV